MDDTIDNNTNREQCTAKSKQSGERCKRRPSPGMNVCVMHGARSRKGINSPRFKTGKYSKYISTERLREIYQAISKGHDLYSSEEDLRLLTARVLHLLETPDSRNVWRDVSAAWAKFKKATRDNDKDAARNWYAQIDQLITQGEASSRRWDEIYKVMKQLDRTRTHANKQVIDSKMLIRYDQALELFAGLIEIVRPYI